VPRRIALSRDGTKLSIVDYAGSGASVVFLHGLAGHAREWDGTAVGLTRRFRVVAADARGHGASERHPASVSPADHVADVEYVLEQLALGPAFVVGQSYGGLTALQLAAKRPDLVRALVVVEADPAPTDQATVDGVATWFQRWPDVFTDMQEATAFFRGPSPRAAAWVGGLEQRGDGLRPGFDPKVMIQTLAAIRGLDLWDYWKRIECRVLVVRGQQGDLGADRASGMASTLPAAAVVEVPDAGHDLHLDQPRMWQLALTRFLESVPTD
jgi:pimeloyl-ACP methyl ester carboxylesterase